MSSNTSNSNRITSNSNRKEYNTFWKTVKNAYQDTLKNKELSTTFNDKFFVHVNYSGLPNDIHKHWNNQRLVVHVIHNGFLIVLCIDSPYLVRKTQDMTKEQILVLLQETDD